MKKLIPVLAGFLCAAALGLQGCRESAEVPDGQTETTSGSTQAAVTETTTETAETQTETTAAPPEPYRFEPHVYSPKLAEAIPQSHWDAFYSLCDALRTGAETFACADEEAYKWATDSVVLGHMFPAACMMISDKSSDGTVPYENGTGKICYSIPPEDYVKRQAEFEKAVEDVLNAYLEPDDDDFEKCLKLCRYMAMNYTYENIPEPCKEGAHYYTFMHRHGVCAELSGVYAYLLMQVGVDAMEVGDDGHAWTYVVLNGQGYHIDPTWSLVSDCAGAKLSLEYFMMTDAHRRADGCDVDDLTVDLLPEYWVNQSSLTFPASDGRYVTEPFSLLESLDEENKILYYSDTIGDRHELYYGAAEKGAA